MSIIGRRGNPSAGSRPGTASTFAESTWAEQAWERMSHVARRWAVVGALCGTVAGAVAFAPADWLADAVARASDGRMLLAEARGSVWSGSAVPVLAGGGDSRVAARVPGRLHWTIGLHGAGLQVALRQPCCIDDVLLLRLRGGPGGLTIEVPDDTGAAGEWPAAWLTGLGAPWNSLQLAGTLHAGTPGLRLQWAAGRWRFDGQAELELADLASRLSTLDRLGSYQVRIVGHGEQPTTLHLSTLDGTLQLQGDGQWTGAQFRFRGEARAAPGFEAALDNLLNILGRRQGALSLLAIG